MVTLYINLDSDVSKQALVWLKEHDIEYKMKRMSHLSETDFMKALSLTENGFLDLLRHPSEGDTQVREELRKIEAMNFENAINFISSRTYLLRDPIILGGNKLVIGYRPEKMRSFVSRAYRTLEIN